RCCATDKSPRSIRRRSTDGQVSGRITIHPAGYGFVATDGGETVFVPAKYRGLSLDGDKVLVATWTGVKGIEGRVETVLARGRARLTGILRRAGSVRMYLEPDDPRIATDYGRVALDGVELGKEGQAVVVEITQYPTLTQMTMAGRVLKVLGDPEDPRTEIEKILAVSSIPLEFPEAVLHQAASTPQTLGPADLADRIDLRSRRFCTIDPETARDFDDALCVEDGPQGGPRVWVAVADVAHYVRWGDALDREAELRGVSVYLPDRVISMLPIELSAGICSLNPDVDRCAMVVRLDFDRDGGIVEAGLAAAVIRSHARLDYPGVAAALGGDFRGRREAYRPWAAELHRLAALSVQMRARRRARGALELEIGEPKVILDADDARLVRDVVRAKGDAAVKSAYELVEEFMIAANEAVGRYFRQRAATTVWRVHAPPKEERRRILAELLSAYNIATSTEELGTPLGMKRVLDELAVHPAARALSFLVLRTLTQAVWDTVPIGHFGLASGDYLHFTSPIRRYPDLLVHRLLKHYLHKEGQASGGGYHKAPPEADKLSELAAASSLHERRAMEAEREAVSMYRAYMMREQVGERYQGVVSAVTSFGVFVEIEEPFVEGLIRIDSLASEPFVFDEVHLRLTGQRTGIQLCLGDSVTVEIRDVSVLRRRIDLGLLSVAQQRIASATELAEARAKPAP
ncbi:MAG TPA: ribonuclease R, partial [Kofleriaceae bacterium]|nr:ribonuclease R [Kofleriaceae bacterium]